MYKRQIWDRLFGTFQEERDEDPVVFGVRKPLANWNPFWANLQVYDYLWFDALRAKRWRDKLGVWFRRTGWRPADVEADYPRRSADLAQFEKFDPPVGPTASHYVVFQFVVAAAGVLWIGNLYATDGAFAVLLPCSLLWVTLLSLGVISEGRPYAQRVEWFRLLCIMPAGTWALLQTGTIAERHSASVWLGLAVYLAISGLVLARSGRIEQNSSLNKNF